MDFFRKIFSCFNVEKEEGRVGANLPPEPGIQRHSVNKKKDLSVVIFNDPDEVYSWHPHI